MRRIARLLANRKLIERKSGAMERERKKKRITPETEYLPREKGRRNEGMEQKNNNREQQQKPEEEDEGGGGGGDGEQEEEEGMKSLNTQMRG